MKVTDFDYELPEELIAQHPVEPRDTARLLTLDKVTGEVAHKEHFYDLIDELHEGDVLVFNNTKVIPARLYGQRQGSGGKKGSAAAPTAGLHFTPELLEKIKAKGVELEFVTLHVGLGTFRPVSAETIEDHEMHSEFFVVSQETADRINAAKRNGRRIIAVGTTSVRTLESATNDDGILQGISGWTQIFIYPGYKFKMIDALVTNFHLPQSTLLMLISALAGREHCLAAYEEAVRERYRFFSFGDAMFIR